MKIIHKNKKAVFDYELLDKFIAGIALTGAEVKSIRNSDINLKGAYVSIKGGEATLKNAHISKYKFSESSDYDPFRARKLLLKKSEIAKIVNHINTQGVTVIPIAIGVEGKHIKVEIAVARGKKLHDKRQSIKERDIKRRLRNRLAR